MTNDFDALQAAVEEAADRLGVEAAILVVKDASGFNALATVGLRSHQDAVLLLASASHMVLMGHDEAVLAGAAGPDRQSVAEALRRG